MYRHHLVLHSFPTRRSSDLQQAGEVRSDVPAGLLLCIAGAAAQFWLHSQMEIKDSLAAVGNAPVSEEEFIGYLLKLRSEEHTSELQSQSNLVCRLLLEKKKK